MRRERVASRLSPVRARAGLGFGLLLVSVLAGGCSRPAARPLPADTPPVTYLSVQGSALDTLSYRQILYWWGSAPDGVVVGYYIHWDGGWVPPPSLRRASFDSTWAFTTATSDTFIVPTRGTQAVRTFSVRAVDNAGVTDPAGRSQVFPLYDHAPTLAWAASLPLLGSSLPSVSYAWKPQDVDGRSTVSYYRYWLDGTDSTRAATTSDTVIALEPADFLVHGTPEYGTRTLKVQAFDEAGTGSNVISHAWNVEQPTGHYLLIDNVDENNVPGGDLEDGYFRAIMDSVATGDYFIYNMVQRQGFRTPLEVFSLLSLFPSGVVWYGGTADPAGSYPLFTNLGRAEKGLGQYLDNGGRVVLVATNAVGDSAALSTTFAQNYLGVSGFYRLAHRGGINLPNRSRIFTSLGAPGDTLQTTNSNPAADFMLLDPDVTPLFWVPPGFLTGTRPSQAATPADLGVLSARHGRIAVVGFLLTRTRPTTARNACGATLLRRVFSG